MSLFTNYTTQLKQEFSGYNTQKLSKDLLSGVTVAAVALPLALAFGVGSGASAASGIVTAVIAGLFIGALSGASYQISGPTGAMTAILVSLVAQYQLQGVFIACLLSGILLLLAGIFKLGDLVAFIPLPVITGFTSGIAVIIALGQINNLTGYVSSGHSTLAKLSSYFTMEQSFNAAAFVIGAAVILFMLIYPKKLNQYCPSSLAAIILATAATVLFKLPIDSVGEIPRSIFLQDRLHLSGINMDQIQNLLIPAVSIAALGLIESLLCGASAGRMKNEKLNAGQELIAQGIGNIVLPFFGGVPATAAIARTSVAISSGAQTRLTSIFHAIVLLLSMFVLGGVMSAIPLSALAGVLIVTAWRMNEWHVIKDIFHKKLKSSISKFLITMAATVIFDLTIAIIIGVFFSIVMFVIKVSDMQINVSDIDPNKLQDKTQYSDHHKRTCVIYITGPLYFGTANKLEEKLSSFAEKDVLIFSMRGVPLADISGVKVLEDLCLRLSQQNKAVYFTCIQPAVMEMFERCGMKEYIGEDKFFWSTDKVLSKLSKASGDANDL
ncbi:MAG: Sulfate permease and related transporter superfamily [Clostridia bacterium]|jgi:SulP family sulfate permease|nr:Sulfate permease and related transporter superfamily [Clostridia bacterium]